MFSSCLSTEIEQPAQEEIISEVTVVDVTEEPVTESKPIVPSTEGKSLSVTNLSIITEPETEIVVNEKNSYILKKVSSPIATRNGRAFKAPFIISISNENNVPSVGVPVLVKYPVKKEAGIIIYNTDTLLSNEKGIVTFESPIPTISCSSEIVFSTENGNSNEFLSIPYQVYTNKLGNGVSISLLDYTQSGTPITNNSLSSSALLTAMYKKGFSNIGNSDFVNEIHSDNLELLYRNAKVLFANRINYLVFGTVKYDTPIEKLENGQFQVTMTTTFRVMDTANGTILLNDSITTTVADKSEWDVINTYRSKYLGPQIAELIYFGI